MINKIVIHCSASPNGGLIRAEDIHNWHVKKGWDGIGYHYVICADGTLEYGRPEYWIGAHTKGHNSSSIGICLIGIDAYSTQQWITLDALVGKLIKNHEGIKVIGHNEVSNKTCPGFDVQKWLQARNRTHNGYVWLPD